MSKVHEYRALVAGYGSGLYLGDEVVSESLGLLYQSDDRDAFWQALAPAHREKDDPLAIQIRRVD